MTARAVQGTAAAISTPRPLKNAEIIRRLRIIGPDASTAFRVLCASAGRCSNCCQRYAPPSFRCQCTPARSS